MHKSGENVFLPSPYLPAWSEISDAREEMIDNDLQSDEQEQKIMGVIELDPPFTPPRRKANSNVPLVGAILPRWRDVDELHEAIIENDRLVERRMATPATPPRRKLDREGLNNISEIHHQQPVSPVVWKPIRSVH